MKTIKSIHDKTFKNALSDVRVAQDFFKHHLPANIQNLVDLNTLKLSQNTYIDEELREFQSDVLYEVMLKNGTDSAYLYLLTEHQSKVDPLMPYRIWNYKVKIWDQHLKQTNEQTLPLIFCLVFYHGREPYDGPRNIADIIRAPRDIVEHDLFGPFELADTHDITDEEIRQRCWSAILQFMFKHAYDREAFLLTSTITELLRKLEGEPGSAIYANTLLKYWIGTAETSVDPNTVIDAIHAGLSTSMRRELMSIGEQLVQQGVQQGMQTGMQLGEAQLLTNILIAKFHNLPPEYLKKIETADVVFLNKWAINALNAPSLLQVFKD